MERTGDPESTRTNAGSSHRTCFPQQLWLCGPRNLYHVAAEFFKLSPVNQQVILFSQLSLGLATKLYSVSIQQTPIANRDSQLGRAKGTEKLHVQNIPSAVVPLSPEERFQTFSPLSWKDSKLMWKVGWSYVKVVLENRDFERYGVWSSQRKNFCWHQEEMPRTSLLVTEIIPLTGPMTVQMACSWQPPLNPSAQGFIGRHVKPSPLYPFWQLQKTFTPSCVHSAALWHPPLFCLQRSAAAWGKRKQVSKVCF